MSQRKRKSSTERVLQSNSDWSGESDLDLPVANENKRGRNSNGKRKPKVKGKRTDLQEETIQIVVEKGKRSVSNAETRTRFVEDDKIMEMEVEIHAEDNKFSGEDSDQQPPNLNQEDDESSVEEGLIESDDESEKEVSFKRTEQYRITSEKDKQDDHVKRIDQQVKQKILELHKLMEESGLKNSAEVLAQLPQVKLNKATKVTSKGKEPSNIVASDDISHCEQIELNESTINFNDNASMKVGTVHETVRDNNAEIDNITAGVNKLTQAKSLETIYESAVPKRVSTSSEDDLINSSGDDSGEENLNSLKNMLPNNKQIEVFIVEARRRSGEVHNTAESQVKVASQGEIGDGSTEQRGEEPMPSTSAGQRHGQQYLDLVDEKVQNMIKDAERAKARIFATQGNDVNHNFWQNRGEPAVTVRMLPQIPNNIHRPNVEGGDHQMLTPSAFVDEGYIVVGAHLDETMISKIVKGEYVDFGKLLPRDRIQSEEDGRMEMIYKNGKTFWSPVSVSVYINSFAKWEQAFRVFSNIYCKANPQRAAELIEYNHIIHTISLQFMWDNVYMYDREFRMHMARNPCRSWAMILQQAWALRLRDRLVVSNSNWSGNAAQNSQRGNGGNPGLVKQEPCRRFNRGKCNFGLSCKYEHRCSYCFKFGHSNVNCRKAIADRERKTGNAGNGNAGGSGQNNHGPHQAVIAQELKNGSNNKN